MNADARRRDEAALAARSIAALPLSAQAEFALAALNIVAGNLLVECGPEQLKVFTRAVANAINLVVALSIPPAGSA